MSVLKGFCCAMAMASLVIGASARAEDLKGFRAGVDFGAWWGEFTQEGFGQEMSLDIDPAVGLQGSLGYGFGPVFVDAVVSWFFVQKWGFADADKRDDASFFSPGLRAGAVLPVAPVELYGGLGHATLGFATGTQNDFAGWAAHAGAGVRLGQNFRAKVEYHWSRFSVDDGGELPGEVTTRGSYFFAGVGAALW